ncbi:MAG: PAS domain S-box protein [Crocinitomicaceae bacterium]|nr:PAS domain S-box protein [Crocinitomicaceae bacterium]
MSFKFNIQQFYNQKSDGFRPYYNHENRFGRIAFIHLIGAFIIAPIFTYAMYRSDAPEIYMDLGIIYICTFPIYLLISWFVPFMRDKLVYLIILHVFISTYFSYRSLGELDFSSTAIFYFFAVYAISSIIIQRLYPAILYHVFVIILLLNSHDALDQSEISPFIVVGLFLVLGIASSFVIYVRRRLIITIEDYSEYLKTIMNNPGSGYVLIDISKTPTVLDYNTEALRVLDIDKSTINEAFFKNINEDEINNIRNLKIGNRHIKNVEFTKFNNKQYIELKTVVLPLKNSLFWLVNINDVTREVLKREELELKEKRYRNLYFRNKAGVFTLDKKTKIIDGNDSFFKMLEGTLKKSDRLFGLNLEVDWELILESLQASEKVNNYQTQYTLTSGVKKTFIFSWYIDEQTGYIEGSVIDLTSKEKASQALKQSEQKYRLIYEESNDAIMLLDGDHLIDVNRKAEELFGISRKDLLEKELFELSHDKSIKYQKNYRFEKAKLSKTRNIRFDWLFKGAEYIIEGEVSLIEVMIDNKLYYQCVIHDQTEQNKLGKEKLRAEVAEGMNIQLEEEIQERIKAETRLQEQFLRTRAIFESSSNTLLLTLSLDGNISSFNSHCDNYFRTSFDREIHEGELFMEYFEKLLTPTRVRLFRILIGQVKRGASIQYEVELRSEKRDFWMEIFMNPIFDTSGNVVEISLVAHDISEKKKASNAMESSLKEKEVLLKEIHHRVKNNLQVISSILNLQSSFVTDKNTLDILQESRNRIRSMAIIHENLYRTEDFSSIKFASYIKNLTHNLIASYSVNRKVILDIDLADVDLVLDQAIPCGLLLNELITNSLKYAWKDGENGIISIRLKEVKNIVELVIKDNGIGLPVEFEKMDSDTLGLQLVITLAEQLDAELKVDVKEGTEYLIKFENIKPISHV